MFRELDIAQISLLYILTCCLVLLLLLRPDALLVKSHHKLKKQDLNSEIPVLAPLHLAVFLRRV